MTLTADAPVGVGDGSVAADHRSRSARALADFPPGGLRDLDVPPPLRPWRERDELTGWIVTAVITALAALTRFWNITGPSNKAFDEVYYATEAQEILRYGYENNPGYIFVVHPSVGKWMIALSSAVFGDNPTGWRVAPALAGTLSVLLIVRIARRMFRSNLLGGVAGLLLTVDGLSMVQSRVALLDIFLQLFLLAAFGALVIDRDQFRARLGRFVAEGGDARDSVPPLGPRPWRLTGGVLLGLACGVKWSAAWFLIAFVVLSLVWDRGAFKSAGARFPTTAALRRSWLGAVGSLGLAPLGAYLLTWVGWWAGENSINRHWAENHPGHGLTGHLPATLRSLLDYHSEAYDFHTHLASPHVYQSTPWSWLVLGRGVLYAYTQTPAGQDGHRDCGATTCVREIVLLGTPFLSWAFVPVLLWLLWHWVTTRDWRAGAVLLAFVAGWGSWARYTDRTMFLFYMTPLMPFLVLGVTLALGVLLGPARVPSLRMLWYRPNWRMLLVAVYLAAVVTDFVWMFPIFADIPISLASWRGHMWFQSWI
ncbi:MAG: phospholipid carrier-dependent glycosyltransferase [bacterium]